MLPKPWSRRRNSKGRRCFFQFGPAHAAHPSYLESTSQSVRLQILEWSSTIQQPNPTSWQWALVACLGSNSIHVIQSSMTSLRIVEGNHVKYLPHVYCYIRKLLIPRAECGPKSPMSLSSGPASCLSPSFFATLLKQLLLAPLLRTKAEVVAVQASSIQLLLNLEWPHIDGGFPG